MLLIIENQMFLILEWFILFFKSLMQEGGEISFALPNFSSDLS